VAPFTRIPYDLVLEITESTLAGNANTVIDTLEKIKGLGIQIDEARS
jgi:EAL domain-containing protein (putative c-di-GMP-specific phosphodiesterase class I)